MNTKQFVECLHYRTLQTIDDIRRELTASHIVDDLSHSEGALLHVKPSSAYGPILGVCHLDFVEIPWLFKHRKIENRIYSTRLDDRLGLAILLDYLPSKGINLDLLLTDNEEIGQSTAGDFCPESHSYNWLLQFDRRGDDVVTYDYTCRDWAKALSSVDFKIGRGTFSDISSLEHLERSGVNVGIGYHKEHSIDCYCELSELQSQLDKSLRFIEQFSETSFVHVPESYSADFTTPWWHKSTTADTRKKWRDYFPPVSSRICPWCGINERAKKFPVCKQCAREICEDMLSRYFDRNDFEHHNGARQW